MITVIIQHRYSYLLGRSPMAYLDHRQILFRRPFGGRSLDKRHGIALGLEPRYTNIVHLERKLQTMGIVARHWKSVQYQ